MLQWIWLLNWNKLLLSLPPLSPSLSLSPLSNLSCSPLYPMPPDLPYIDPILFGLFLICGRDFGFSISTFSGFVLLLSLLVFSFMSFIITSLHLSFGLPIFRCPPTSIFHVLNTTSSSNTSRYLHTFGSPPIVWSVVAQWYNAGLAIVWVRIRIPLCYRFKDWAFLFSPLTPLLTQLYKWVPGYRQWWKCEWFSLGA